MAGVPDQAVAAEVERGVQRQRQLDHAEIRGEVGAAGAQQLAKRLAHLACQLVELLGRQAFQVVGRLDVREDAIH